MRFRNSISLVALVTVVAGSNIAYAKVRDVEDANLPASGIDWSKTNYIRWQNQPEVSLPVPNPERFDKILSPRAGLELRFADDFNKPGQFSVISHNKLDGVWTPAGNGYLDTLNWRYIASQAGEHIYVDKEFLAANGLPKNDLNPLVIKNGELVIRALRVPDNTLDALKKKFSSPAEAERLGKRNVFSGSISTQNSFHFKYGYMEVRAKMPKGKGLWPAIWLLRADKAGAYGEIDVTEFISTKPNQLHSGILYTPDSSKYRLDFVKNPLARDNPDEAVNRKTLKYNINDDYHRYGLEWNEKEIITYFDDMEVGRAKTPNALKAEMYILLNMAVGGTWAGPTDKNTPFPAEFKIDYVRVWQKPGTPVAKVPRPDAFVNGKWETYEDFKKRFNIKE